MSLIAPVAYLRVTEKHSSHVRWHQVWDAELFVKTQREVLFPKGITVAVITEEEYRDEKWGRAPGKAKVT